MQFRENNGYLQWKYTEEDEWHNLYEINSAPAPEGLVRVRYVLDGGAMPSGVADYVDVTSGASIVLPTPEKAGYAFDGWYLSGEEYPVSTEYRVHESVTLTARWIPGALLTGTLIYTVSEIGRAHV